MNCDRLAAAVAFVLFAIVALAWLVSCAPVSQAEAQRNAAMWGIAADAAPHMQRTYGCIHNSMGGQNCTVEP